MNPDKPPAYSENNASGINYQPLSNEAFEPCSQEPPRPYPQPMQNVYMPNNPYPYGNMPQSPNQFVFAAIQQPQPIVPATTVNVNTGPIEKRYCCSCCCTCFWIIVVLLIIAGILRSIH